LRQLNWFAGAVEAALARAIWAITRCDTSAARRLIAEDRQLNRTRYELEQQALLLIARQQPFASDLRMISTVIDLAGELERIADYAKGIGEIVLRGAKLAPLDAAGVLGDMPSLAREMFQEARQAINDRDVDAMHRLERADDVVDRLYDRTLASLIAMMHEDPALIEPALYLIWAAHNLERIADRTVNMAERAAFMAGHPPIGPF
jgi:phosphate transport system protein